MLKEKWEEKSNMAEITGNYNVAMVKFLTGENTNKTYAFALFDREASINDYVVCDTVRKFPFQPQLKVSFYR